MQQQTAAQPTNHPAACSKPVTAATWPVSLVKLAQSIRNGLQASPTSHGSSTAMHSTAHKAAVAAAAAVPTGMPFAGTGHMCKAALFFAPASHQSAEAVAELCAACAFSRNGSGLEAPTCPCASCCAAARMAGLHAYTSTSEQRQHACKSICAAAVAVLLPTSGRWAPSLVLALGSVPARCRTAKPISLAC